MSMSKFWAFKYLAVILVMTAFIPLMIARADEPPAMINGYHITIDAGTYLTGKVKITETFTIEPGWLSSWRADHPNMNLDGTLVMERWVNVSVTAGVYEINIVPLETENIDDVRMRVEKGVTSPVTMEGRMCDYDCKPQDVQVINLPANTNLQRKNATNMNISTYNGKDSLTWTLMSIRQGIGFNFISPEALGLKELYQRIWDFGLVGQISLLLGTIGSFVIGLIVAEIRRRLTTPKASPRPT